MHRNLPGNPIDLEQREGRINRFKGLVVRQQLALRYANELRRSFTHGDPWDDLFKLADIRERQSSGKCELIPYWHTDTDEVAIERMIPMYPFSQDQVRLERILKTLYNLSLSIRATTAGRIGRTSVGKRFLARGDREYSRKTHD
ncbi:MAG: hypothetical protein PF795_14970 [Kiritimatiellae bacterium]|nr:hypothetical protein [Kiritimatiellia bacterium]